MVAKPALSKKSEVFSGKTAALGGAGRVGCPAGGCVQYRPQDAGGWGRGKLRLGQRRAEEAGHGRSRLPIPATRLLVGNRVPTYGRSSGTPVTPEPPQAFPVRSPTPGA